MEIWKDVKGYEKHYKVSNLGRVKSIKFNKEKVLSKTKLSNGYLKVLLCKNGKSKTKTVHSLVAESFLNHKSNIYIVVDHINNIKTDNKLSNLQIISQRENSSKDRKNKYSNYTGVTFHKNDNKWQSSIVIDGQQIYLGYFKSESRASIAYNFALTQLDKLKEYNLTR
tara:strand:- start:1843 stop:2346 length:504 start_codon:yes stop_codon:yes gene_type:complete